MTTPMTSKTTPDDDWLSEVFNEVLKGAAIRMGKGDEMLRADLIEAHAAINAKITELLIAELRTLRENKFWAADDAYDAGDVVSVTDIDDRIAQLQASQPIKPNEMGKDGE